MVSERIFLPIVHLECMLLIIQHFKSYLISFGSVIVQLDWAIQKKANWIIRSSRIMTNIETGFAMNIKRQKPRRSIRPRMSEDTMSCLPDTH